MECSATRYNVFIEFFQSYRSSLPSMSIGSVCAIRWRCDVVSENVWAYIIPHYSNKVYIANIFSFSFIFVALNRNIYMITDSRIEIDIIFCANLIDVFFVYFHANEFAEYELQIRCNKRPTTSITDTYVKFTNLWFLIGSQNHRFCFVFGASKFNPFTYKNSL